MIKYTSYVIIVVFATSILREKYFILNYRKNEEDRVMSKNTRMQIAKRVCIILRSREGTVISGWVELRYLY